MSAEAGSSRISLPTRCADQRFSSAAGAAIPDRASDGSGLRRASAAAAATKLGALLDLLLVQFVQGCLQPAHGWLARDSSCGPAYDELEHHATAQRS